MIKRLIITLIALLPLVCVAQGDALAQIEFKELIYDFGELKEVDGEVSHSFEYTNTGSIPFVLYNTTTSCGCTTSDYDSSPMRGGESRTLKVVFDPTNQPGRVEKTIYVRGNIANGVVALKIRAQVEPRPRGVQDDYPVELSDGVRVEDIVLEVGQRANSLRSQATLGVVNNSKKSAKVTIGGGFTFPEWVSIEVLKPELEAGESTEILVSIDPSQSQEMLWGAKGFVIPILVNSRAQYNNPTGRVTFVEDFTGATTGSDAPRARANNAFYHFSTVELGASLKHCFEIENTGKGTLYIRYADHSPRVKSTIEQEEIAGGETAKLCIELDSSSKGGKSEIIRVITSDPIRPVIELRVMAMVEEK